MQKGGVCMKTGSAEMKNASGVPFGDIIRNSRKRKQLSQEQLGALVQVKKNAVGAWEAGRSRPDLSSVPSLCEALDISLNSFFGYAAEDKEEWEIYYDRLNARNRKIILRQMERLYRLQDPEVQSEERKIVCLRLNHDSASAGPVSFLGENGGEKIYLSADELTENSDELIRVSGDSMEPLFCDGDIVFLQYSDHLQEGEIGIFIHDDAGYIKEYRKDGLYSRNPRYAPIRFSENDSVRCVGRVLGTLKSEQLATGLEIDRYRMTHGEEV